MPDSHDTNALRGYAGLSALGSFLGGNHRVSLLGQSIKRKAFFSFQFDDVMRVNVIRNAWKVGHPDTALMRSFYDSSLWECRALEGDDAVKRLIREGVEYTSAVCVLVGSGTWSRRWVRYEIARAVIDGRGLLAVHINGIKHHRTLVPDARGPNPFDFMAVGKVQSTPLYAPDYYLFERAGTGWQRYRDYTWPVSKPAWLSDPPPGYVMPLASGVEQHDYMAEQGHLNIGAWLDRAAQRAGR